MCYSLMPKSKLFPNLIINLQSQQLGINQLTPNPNQTKSTYPILSSWIRAKYMTSGLYMLVQELQIMLPIYNTQYFVNQHIQSSCKRKKQTVILISDKIAQGC